MRWSARYAGTRLGRQELDGEIVEERADALWSRARDRDAAASRRRRRLQRIVVAVDPPASAVQGADACGLVAAGRAEDGTIYVIADETAAGLSPAGWSRAGHRAVAQACTPTRWWSRSTRAATWCAR